MFKNAIPLFRIAGFPVKLDPSWLILALLVTWTLAAGYFPMRYHDLTPLAYWLMGAVSALGLFMSIILHEFSHSMVAHRMGLPISGITLFIFGGIAEMQEEPENPKTELLMAIAGPICSFALAAVFGAFSLVAIFSQWPLPVIGVLSYLSIINFILAIFNLVPAFPLDGGRVLRALLWLWKHDMVSATRITARLGRWFGIFLMAWGVFDLLSGQIISGGWKILIGVFLRSAARGSYEQLVLREALKKKPVSNFMKPFPVTLAPDISVKTAMDDYFQRYFFKMFPVVSHNNTLGFITLDQIKKYPEAQWNQLTVADLMTPVSAENTIEPENEAINALSKMNQSGNSRLLVVLNNNQLAGILSLSDLLNFLSFKQELDRPSTP